VLLHKWTDLFQRLQSLTVTCSYARADGYSAKARTLVNLKVTQRWHFKNLGKQPASREGVQLNLTLMPQSWRNGRKTSLRPLSRMPDTYCLICSSLKESVCETLKPKTIMATLLFTTQLATGLFQQWLRCCASEWTWTKPMNLGTRHCIERCCVSTTRMAWTQPSSGCCLTTSATSHSFDRVSVALTRLETASQDWTRNSKVMAIWQFKLWSAGAKTKGLWK